MKIVRISLLLLMALAGKYASGLEIRGRVIIASSGCPVSGLNVEIDPEKGSAQVKVVTATDANGEFNAQVLDGRYLLQIFQNGVKVYQNELTGKGITPINVSLNTVQGGVGKTCLPVTPVS